MFDRQDVYRALIRLLPRPGYTKGRTGLELSVAKVLAKHRVAGASVSFFGGNGQGVELQVGTAGKARQVDAGTFFRIASVSKMLTAMCTLRLAQDGKVRLDADIQDVLPYPVRHPRFPDVPITLAMLLTHTSGLQDGASYHRGIGARTPVPELLAGDSWGEHAPGTVWAYSNFGAGLAACVLEGALQQSFENSMQQHLFVPLGVTASFYPQRIKCQLADAFRVLPPWGQAGFDASERKRRPDAGADTPDPTRHYTLAQGNAVTDMQGMKAIVRALMTPGYLSLETLTLMRMPAAPFGRRSPFMQQGLGLFLIDLPEASPRTLYGHQGNAYGAMHGAFLDPVTGRGMVLMTSAASEAKTNFLSDLNRDLMRLCFREHTGEHID